MSESRNAKANQVEPFAYVREPARPVVRTFAAGSCGLLPDAWLTATPKLVGAGRGSGAPKCAKSRISDLTAMRDFELRR